jgi:hypothetical protein
MEHRSRRAVAIVAIAMIVGIGVLLFLLIDWGGEKTTDVEVNNSRPAPAPKTDAPALADAAVSRVAAVEKPPSAPATIDTASRVALAGEIRGRAVFDSRGIGGVRVLAFPSSKVVDVNVVDRALAGEGAAASTTTTADGTFVLSNLEPGRNYSLHAGGNGFGLWQPKYYIPANKTGADAGANLVELALLPVFAIVLELIDDNGRPLRGSRDVYFDRIASITIPFATTAVTTNDIQKGKRFMVPDETKLICGLPLAYVRPPNKHCEVVATFERQESDETPPLRITLSRLGYEAEPIDLAVPRLREDVAVKTVSLKSTGLHANVTIELVGLTASAAATMDRARLKHPIGELEFRNPGKPAFHCAVWSVEKSRVRYEAIPYGNYEVQFIAHTAYHKSKNTPVVIEHPEEIISVSVLPEDATDIGSLNVKVKRADGTPYNGKLSVHLFEGRSPRRGDAIFNSGPYLLDFLPAKKIRLMVFPSPGDGYDIMKGRLETFVEIRSQQETVLELTMK